MRRLLAAASVVAFLPCRVLSAGDIPPGSVRVTFLDVARKGGGSAGEGAEDEYMRRLERNWGRGGIGDSAVIETSGKCVLIDGGLWTKGRTVVLPYLRRRGVKALDAVVLTHQHGDHYGGLTEVVPAMPVGEVLTNGLTHSAKAYRIFMEAVVESGARYRVPRPGEKLDWGGGVTATVLISAGAAGVRPDDYNNNSLVLRMTCGETSFLFAGDMEKTEEAALLSSRRELKSAVLKVGHHGSSTSSSFPFLQAVRPEIAVISIGEGNRFGLPHRPVIDRLRSFGCKVYRTDLDGTVTVTSDGARVSVETERERPRAETDRKPFPEEYYRIEGEADGLFRKKDYAAAAAAYRKAIGIEPGAAAVHSRLGYCYKRMGKRGEAVKAFLAALERDPCDPFANLHLGIISMDEDRGKALGYFEKYLECHPDAAWSGVAREKAALIREGNGMVHRKAGREEEAIAEFEKAIALCPGRASAHFQLGMLYAARDRPRARAEMKKCLEMEPGGPDAAAAREALSRMEKKP